MQAPGSRGVEPRISSTSTTMAGTLLCRQTRAVWRSMRAVRALGTGPRVGLEG